MGQKVLNARLVRERLSGSGKGGGCEICGLVKVGDARSRKNVRMHGDLFPGDWTAALWQSVLAGQFDRNTNETDSASSLRGEGEVPR